MPRRTLATVLLLAPAVAAAAPEIPWQARLLDAQGVAITGTHAVTVTLRDGASATLWSRTYAGVSFSDGYVSLVLSGTDDAARTLEASWFLDPVYVSVAIDGGAELSPAVAVTSVPRAASVVGSVRLGADPSTCDAGHTATLRWANDRVEVCNGSAWVPVSSSSLGLSANTAATSCKAILADDPTAASGAYWLDPDGVGGYDPFQVHCEMGVGTGGWTQILHLSGNGQITNGTGGDRTAFWSEGGTLSASWAVTPFAGLTSTDQGFVGWNRLAPLLGGDVEVLVTGTNTLSDPVSETYTLQAFAPNMADTTLETGTILGGGQWSVARYGDTDTRNGWGTCGTGVANNVHVGLGICPSGFNGSAPFGNEVQVWHYGTFSNNVNLSFGEPGSGTNYTYNNTNLAEIRIYLRE